MVLLLVSFLLVKQGDRLLSLWLGLGVSERRFTSLLIAKRVVTSWWSCDTLYHWPPCKVMFYIATSPPVARGQARTAETQDGKRRIKI